MKQIVYLIFWGLITVNVQAQTIKGQVFDAENSPVEYASIRLLKKSDSTVITGAYSDEYGRFELEIPHKSPPSFLKITFANHVPYWLELPEAKGKVIELNRIQLELDKALELEEVTATGSLDALKAGIDKKVYQVGEDLSSKGGTANDVLNNVPSIEVDQDGNISLRGDGNVTILINGRPSTLVGNDGQNVLDAFPANSIERIEVVTNPSAKYDPDGTSGIINIILKKNRLIGFNGIASATVATGNLYQMNLGLSYRNKKFNTNLNYSFDYYEGYRNFSSDLLREVATDTTIHLVQDRQGTDLKSSHTIVLGTEYLVNQRNTIGFSVTGTLGQRKRTGDLQNFLYDNDEVLTERWDRNSEDPRLRKGLDFNVHYQHDLLENKGEFSINATHSIGNGDVEGYYEQLYYDVNGNPSGLAPLNQQLFNTNNDQVTTLQTDFSKVYDSIRARMEIGAKAIMRKQTIDTYSEQQDTITGNFFPDTLANFNYQYDESVYSIYGIFGQELGVFKYQIGVRGELAQQVPYLVSQDTMISNAYLNLFPSAHVKYALNGKSELSLSYSKRINRAKARQLNPFTSYADPFNLRSGNPFLQPEYIHSFDLGYAYSSKKFIFSSSVFHRRTSDVINRVKIYYDDNTSRVSYQNIDHSYSTGLETIIIYKPFSWIKNTLSFNGNYIEYENNNPLTEWNNNGLNWTVKYILSVEFWKKTASFQLNAKYNSPRVAAQGIYQPRTGIDFGFEKRFFNNKLSVATRVTDIFNTKGFEIDLEQTGVQQHSEYKWLTRRIYLTLSYRWGKFDKVKRIRTSSGGGMD